LKRSIIDLSLQEVFALAIEIEKNNAERFKVLAEMYLNFDEKLYLYFNGLAKEELEHLAILNLRWQTKYGSQPIPQVDEMEIKEVVETVDVEHGEHQLFDDISREDAFRIARNAEIHAREFYLQAAKSVNDRDSKDLFNELAEFENSHVQSLDISKLEN
jgi:rubrerythrin